MDNSILDNAQDTTRSKSDKRHRTACRIIIFSGVGAILIHFLFYRFSAFADWFNINISAKIRFLLANLTGILPFSLAETVIICLPCAVIILAIICINTIRKKSESESSLVLLRLTALLCALYFLFVFSFASGYRGAPLAEKLSLEDRAVSAEELFTTASYFKEKAQNELDSINFMISGESVIPYSYTEMIDKLNDAYADVSERYSFIPSLRSRVKLIALSKPMTYTHISGVYTYYTGEANININFPDYTIPYTAAHEMSHQRGVAPENEANFMAFLVCESSDDPYIRYSGYMNMLEYVNSALYSADKDLYNLLWSDMDMRMQYEEIQYNKFFEKYSESKASVVSGAVNDTYLKVQGQKEGSKTYGMVVDLAVSYVLDNVK